MKLSKSEIDEWFRQMMNSIEYIHSKNILHRDIKPANILIKKVENSIGILKLADFGLAIYIDNNDAKKSPGGTREYMSPEVISSKADFDLKSDIW